MQVILTLFVFSVFFATFECNVSKCYTCDDINGEPCPSSSSDSQAQVGSRTTTRTISTTAGGVKDADLILRIKEEECDNSPLVTSFFGESQCFKTVKDGKVAKGCTYSSICKSGSIGGAKIYCCSKDLCNYGMSSMKMQNVYVLAVTSVAAFIFRSIF